MSTAASLSATIERVMPQPGEVILGGESAAARKLGLKAGALTLYIDLQDPNVMRGLTKELMLRRDAAGPIELLGIFWNTLELSSFPTVPDALIYADLIGTGEGRAMEIAAGLRKEICAYVEGEV